MIEIEQLSHWYGQRQALREVSLRIEPGEIFAFLGPNGSGKTTLFRILTTLMPVQNGRVVMMGRDLAAARDELRRHIGVVFQSPSLDLELTAEENLFHHAHLYGLRGPELRRRADAMLERFALSQRRRERVKNFSGGLRRRLELAKGLLTEPRILLMDEPSTGLDPVARIEMWELLRRARERDGVTILLTTHLMDEAERSDRLAVMDGGRIVACGTPAQLKEMIGGDVIWLTSGDIGGLRTAIRERFALEAEQIDGALRIEKARAHEFVPQLVEGTAGLIESVSVGKPTLEDVFIHVTGRHFREIDG